MEKELFEVSNNVPDKHNLQFFPTVNDLQNHIHQAAKDVESGMLPITTNTVSLYLYHKQWYIIHGRQCFIFYFQLQALLMGYTDRDLCTHWDHLL